MAFKVDRDDATEVLVPVDTEVVTLHDELIGTEGAIIPFLTIGGFVLRVLGDLEDFFFQMMGGFHPCGEGAKLNAAGDQLTIRAHLVLTIDDREVGLDVLTGHAAEGVGGDGESESDESHG